MGGKYQIRTTEKREFGDTTDYYVDTFWEYFKLRIQKRGQILFVTKRYQEEE